MVSEPQNKAKHNCSAIRLKLTLVCGRFFLSIRFCIRVGFTSVCCGLGASACTVSYNGRLCGFSGIIRNGQIFLNVEANMLHLQCYSSTLRVSLECGAGVGYYYSFRLPPLRDSTGSRGPLLFYVPIYQQLPHALTHLLTLPTVGQNRLS